MNYKIDEKSADLIADALVDEGYIVFNELLPQEILDALVERAHTLKKDEMKEALLGRGSDEQLIKSRRSDKTMWIEGKECAEAMFLSWSESLRIAMNERLYMGLFDYESHFALYENEARYEKHLDAFRGKSNRKLTTVLYLNENWKEDDGGELLIYAENSNKVIKRVEPRKGVMVLFLSEKFPHEVLKSHAARYSIAGWFRVNADIF